MNDRIPESIPNTFALEDWEKAAAKSAGSPEKLVWRTPEGIEVKPLYTADDLAGAALTPTRCPGFEPFVRGPQPTMYAVRPWTIRQYAGFSTAEESNAFYRRNLAAGQQGVSVAFDLATHRGYDSDHPRVVGDVGKAGVAIDSVEDMKILFDGIPLDKVSVSMTMNGAVLPVLAGYIVAAEEQGVAQEQLSGTIQNDILKEFMVRNTYIYPPEPSMRIVADIIEYTARHMPKFNSISISGYHMQEAGATQALELAFTLADGREYVRAALARGLDVDEFAGRLSFFFGIGMNFYLEVAKLRAARLLWWRIMKAFDPKSPRSMMLRTHCQTSGWSLTEQDPYNNVVRTTIEAMAAVFGGTQSLHTNSFDEAIALPTRLLGAHRAQHPAHPPGGDAHPGGRRSVGRLLHDGEADPGHGRRGVGDHRGGRGDGRHDQGGRVRLGQAQDRGVRRREAGAHRPRRGRDRRREQVPARRGAADRDPRDRQHRGARGADQAPRRAVKAKRDRKAVDAALAALTDAAAQPARATCWSSRSTRSRARATVGEIERRAGEGVGPLPGRPARRVSGVYGAAFGRTPAGTRSGPTSTRSRPRKAAARASWSRSSARTATTAAPKVIATAFADLGFDVDIGPLFQTPEEAARQAIENDVHAIGVSTLAAGHKTLVPAARRGAAQTGCAARSSWSSAASCRSRTTSS